MVVIVLITLGLVILNLCLLVAYIAFDQHQEKNKNVARKSFEEYVLSNISNVNNHECDGEGE